MRRSARDDQHDSAKKADAAQIKAFAYLDGQDQAWNGKTSILSCKVDRVAFSRYLVRDCAPQPHQSTCGALACEGRAQASALLLSLTIVFLSLHLDPNITPTH